MWWRIGTGWRWGQSEEWGHSGLNFQTHSEIFKPSHATRPRRRHDCPREKESDEIWWKSVSECMVSTWACTLCTVGRGGITHCCQNKAAFPRITAHLELQVCSVGWSADPQFPVKQEEPNERRRKFKLTHSWQLLRWVNAGVVQEQQCVCLVSGA